MGQRQHRIDNTFSLNWYPYRLKWIFTYILMLCGIILMGQKKQFVEILYTNLSIKEKITKYVDSNLVQKYINDHILELRANGYPYITLDTAIYRTDTFSYYFYKGEKYAIGGLDLTKEQISIIESSGIRRTHLNGKNIDSTLLYSYLKSLVSHQNNNGYPFALAGFDDLRFDNHKLYARLSINKGKLIYFDSIVMEGRLDMKPLFFSRLLDIKKGSPYSHEKVMRSSSLIRDLQYGQQRTEPYVRFINDKAAIVLTLDPKPASRFDFLIGVLPQLVNGVRKWNLIVDINAEFNNSFRRGEYTFVQFKRLKPENLELQLKSTVPYIGGLPVGSHVDFRMFKNGLQNLDLYFDGGTQYLFGGFNQFRLFGSYRSSRLLEIDKNTLLNTGRLPSRLDLSYSGVGIGINLRQLDYRFNPTKGYNAEITAVMGRKKIIPNRQIIDIPEFANSYDSLKLSTLQGELNVNAAYYFRVKNWASIKTELNGGWRYNENRILTNELMRIGGNRLLRGFDEESIFTDFYLFSTAEFRIIFDQNSYLSLPFIDYGFVSTYTDNIRQTQPVLGIGMGLNFGTAAGVFNISFAAGRQGNNPLDFSRMKIHFGYVNLF